MNTAHMITPVMAMDHPPRRGRPAKSPDERLSELMTFRVTKDDTRRAYRFAQRHGVPLDEVLRKVLRKLTAHD